MLIRSRFFLHPYARLMRLHQPVGIWLLLWPCWWSLALAAEQRIMIYGLFALGALSMRAAGCIINDLWDRDFDRCVERTKQRPLASGEVSTREALIILLILLVSALMIAMMLGAKVIVWSLVVLPLVILYPFMKRIIGWPQLFLGMTFNWGVLVASVAATGEVSLAAWILYLACVCWTVGYDTIYAHQDRRDDVQIGVRSTALTLGTASRQFISLCYAVFAMLLFIATNLGGLALLLFVALLLHLIWQIRAVDLDTPESCQRIFASNAQMGVLVFAMVIF